MPSVYSARFTNLAANAQGSQLPQIERIRLSAQQSPVSKADRLREVRYVHVSSLYAAASAHSSLHSLRLTGCGRCVSLTCMFQVWPLRICFSTQQSPFSKANRLWEVRFPHSAAVPDLLRLTGCGRYVYPKWEVGVAGNEAAELANAFTCVPEVASAPPPLLTSLSWNFPLKHSGRKKWNLPGQKGANVVQYYQDSADKGNVDAQTAVGQKPLWYQGCIGAKGTAKDWMLSEVIREGKGEWFKIMNIKFVCEDT
eukprot:1160095-Pelagomonas_calceolata.AAC.7